MCVCARARVCVRVCARVSACACVRADNQGDYETMCRQLALPADASRAPPKPRAAESNRQWAAWAAGKAYGAGPRRLKRETPYTRSSLKVTTMTQARVRKHTVGPKGSTLVTRSRTPTMHTALRPEILKIHNWSTSPHTPPASLTLSPPPTPASPRPPASAPPGRDRSCVRTS